MAEVTVGQEASQKEWLERALKRGAEQSRACLALPINCYRRFCRGGQVRIWDREASHTVPAHGQGSEPSRALPSTRDLQSGHHRISSAILRSCSRSTQWGWDGSTSAETPHGTGAALEGHFALRSHLGHNVCFWGLSNPSNVCFTDHWGRNLLLLAATPLSHRLCCKRGAARSPLRRHPCYEDDTPPVTLFTPTVAVNLISTLTFSSCLVTHERLWCSV